MKQIILPVAAAFLALIISSCGGDATDSPSDSDISTRDSADSASDPEVKLVPCEVPYQNEECISIELPCITVDKYDLAALYNYPCVTETIKIPNGRPIYAFLVSGFDQNRDFDKFHFYNFAKEIFRQANLVGKKAYVHFAWWNNLLAPYMEKPLHDPASVPSHGGAALQALPDYFGFVYGVTNNPTKAMPPDDYQFQKDARAVLTAIRDHNPGAIIILAGHSMGGDSVIRLADKVSDDTPANDTTPAGDNIKIDLLAPIDPVGNRTCLPNEPDVATKDMVAQNTTCNGAYNFTRYQAINTDWFYGPERISFNKNNIGYLYHRWQTESAFPFDYGCPDRWFVGLCPPQPHMMGNYQIPHSYLFSRDEQWSGGIGQGSTNVQSRVSTSVWSGFEGEPPWWCPNCGGFIDGHGEIVGFRGLLGLHSYPMALEAQGTWPSRDGEQNLNDPNDPTRRSRIILLRTWELDPNYLEFFLPGGPPHPRHYAPKRPDLCMVSDDLIDILSEIIGQAPAVNHPPLAISNGPYVAECEGTTTTISLDGTGSSDPEGADLAYLWQTDCPGVIPDDPTSSIDDPTSATPVLTVNTLDSCAVECIVELTVTDDTRPTFGKKDHNTALVFIRPIPGDIDADNDVDTDDIALLTAARNQPANGPDDPRDLDGDGLITVLDARKLVLLCTNPRCATN